MGEVYGCGVWRIGGIYGGVGRSDEAVENCELFEVDLLCRTRLLRPVKVTSAADGEYSAIPSPAKPSFSAAGRERSKEFGSREEESFRK